MSCGCSSSPAKAGDPVRRGSRFRYGRLGVLDRPVKPGDDSRRWWLALMTNPHNPSAEDSLIARYFKPLATDPGAFGLVDDAAILRVRRRHRRHHRCRGRGRALSCHRSARHHRAQGAAGEPVRSRRQGGCAGRLRADAGAAQQGGCLAQAVRGCARRGRQELRLPAARRRHGVDAGAADDLDHRLRPRAEGPDGRPHRRASRATVSW